MITQDQFNMFMTAYEASIGCLCPTQTHSNTGWMGNRQSNHRVPCFNCGIRGHYADTCTNQVVTQFEQQQIRDEIRRDRKHPEQEPRTFDRRLQPPLTGANTTEVVPRVILSRQGSDKVPSLPTRARAPVFCIRVCAVSRKELVTACVLAARIPAVRTIFENSLAEKSARVEEGDTESIAAQRATKVLRRMREVGESSIQRRSQRPTNNPLAYGREHNLTVAPDAEEKRDTPMPLNRTDHPDEISEEDSNDEEVDLVMLPLPSPQLRKAKARTEIAPINWMKGQTPFRIEDALNGPTSSLHITLPQLLDYSPRLRRDLAELLRSSIPKVRKKRIPKNKQSVQPAGLHFTKFPLGNEVTSETSSGIDDNIECHYIQAWIGNFRVPEVLVHAGAMLDLVLTKLLDKLHLDRYPVSGLGMRLADD